MKLKTLKDIDFEKVIFKEGINIDLKKLLKQEAIKHIKEALRKRKNVFNAWMYSMDITEDDLK